MNYKFTSAENNSVFLIEEDGFCAKSILVKSASDNTDYQQYLEWLAEGNTPLPADEV